MKVRSISAKKTYALRQLILRPNHPVETCHFPEDNDDSSAHFGSYLSGELVGIISIFNVKEPDCSDDNVLMEMTTWQIRALATHELVRGMGYAAQLLKSAEEYADLHKGKVVWCNARMAAVGFYLKQGYQLIGEEFEIAGVGPHFLMKKRILDYF